VRLPRATHLRLVGIGLVLGVFPSLASARLLSSLLFEITGTDPLTYIGVSVMLLLVGFAACVVPARRAARVDPIVALRQE
jgi:putative ABC transport system permease protein